MIFSNHFSASRLRCIIFAILISCSFAGFIHPLNAASNPALFPFSAEVIPSAALIEPFGFYHLSIQNAQTVTLQARLTNHSNRSIKLQTDFLNAYSTVHGIFYDQANHAHLNQSSILQKSYELNQYAKPIPTIHLQALETRDISFRVAIPDLKIGTMLGAIRFKNLTPVQPGQSNHSNFSIQSTQAIELAIQIDFKKTDKPKFLVPVSASFDAMHNCLRVQFRQTSKQIRKEVSGRFAIQDIANQESSKGSFHAPALAPSSQFEHCLPWYPTTIKTGMYRFTFQEHMQSTSITEPLHFHVTNDHLKQIKNLAQTADSKYVFLSESSWPKWIWALFIVIIFESVIIIWRFSSKK